MLSPQNTGKSDHKNFIKKDVFFGVAEKKRTFINYIHFPFYLALLAILIIIVDLGFEHSNALQIAFNIYYNLILLVGLLSLSLPYIAKNRFAYRKVKVIDAFLIISLSVIILFNLLDIIALSLHETRNFITLFLIVLIFIREFFNMRMEVNNRLLGPAQLFVISFLAVIFLGSFLLKLPKATYDDISYTDALFTAASAVCVTGLNVVDTEFVFTIFGQVIVLLLIQIGGLGIMTITTYFSYFFRGGSSYKSQLLVKDITNEQRLNEVFSSLKSILLVTFIIEGLGALLIFMFIKEDTMGLAESIFFSIFHAISSFCNAGFSTLSGNLYDSRIRFDYPIHIVIAFLVIIGGIGFPIIHNLWQYTIINLKNHFKRIFKKEKYMYTPWVITVNSHIVLITTAILLVMGTLGFYIFERNGVLMEHTSGVGKVIVSFFGSVTTRTAGFNSTDTGALTIPTTLMMIILMWIGASPASTGGGIKTTTFAVAVMNFIALIKGAKRIEYRGREISQLSVSRAFAQMILAILCIMVVTFILIEIEPDKEPMNLLFEAVSAYGTVGLSRNVTPFLTDGGKLLITATMFIGRVSLFTLLVSLTRKKEYSNYKYPSEDLLIN